MPRAPSDHPGHRFIGLFRCQKCRGDWNILRWVISSAVSSDGIWVTITSPHVPFPTPVHYEYDQGESILYVVLLVGSIQIILPLIVVHIVYTP